MLLLSVFMFLFLFLWNLYIDNFLHKWLWSIVLVFVLSFLQLYFFKRIIIYIIN
jgi:hypothetical protein